jgi:hypothetical protein
VIPLKDKTGKTLVAAFTTIIKSGRPPVRLQTDKGTEFTNSLPEDFERERRSFLHHPERGNESQYR